MSSPWSQHAFDLRLDWGLRGGRELVAGGVRTVVVVDVPSFTTSVSVAVDRGTAVWPHPWDLASAVALADAGVEVVAGCLRNADAVGGWLATRAGPVGVVAAGERWTDDGSLRPAVEDLWGAGAVVDAFRRSAPQREACPEAEVARTASGVVRADPLGWLARCASGVELGEKGFAADVAVAAQLDATAVVPLLTDGWFVPSP